LGLAGPAYAFLLRFAQRRYLSIEA
jgi:hypothetical protein